MVNYNYDRIQDMISSSDKENSYLAACLLRKDKSTYCKELLKKIPVQDRIKVIDDIYEELDITDDVIIFKSPIASLLTPFQRYINACAIIPLIVKVYNGDNILDWSNTNQSKYLPYYKYSSGSGWSFYDVGGSRWAAAGGPAGQHYYDSNLLKDACTKFNSIYIDYISYTG